VSLVDERAPILVRAEIVVDADPEGIWALLADIPTWPEWDPGIREARLDGELTVGTTVRWASGSGRMTSRLTAVEPNRRLAYSGRSMGLRTRQCWTIEPRESGATVSVEASVGGLPARLLGRRLRRDTQASLDARLRLLKLEAEQLRLGIPPGGAA
jgi:uncharacterized protein YndB with AHSA1/START domain